MFERLFWQLCLFVGLALPSSFGWGSDEKPPNILFIFADDHAYEAIGALGHTDIDTPNLDRLTRSGTTFTRAYNMGAWGGAVCVASRCMLLTGRYLWHARAVYDSADSERAAGRFWTEYMRGAGYESYFTGKWHVKADASRAFDHARNIRGGMPNQTKEGYLRPIEGQPDKWSPFDPSVGGFWKGGKHWSEVVADDAVDFLDQAAQRDQPFFMYVAFNAPHDPRQSPKEYIDRYPLDRIRLPLSFQAEYPYKDAIGCGENLRDERLAPFPRSEYAVKVNRQEYYAIISHMDTQIGRILDALQATGKQDNTWIFFTADHGLAVGHHGLLGKQNMYEHSVRVPFIVVAPSVGQGEQIDTPIYLQDVMPTTLQLAAVDRPDHVQFKSLLPLLKERGGPHYDAIYGAYTKQQRMVVDDGYKLILYPNVPKVRLFHVASDPHEMTDLANDPKYQPVIRKLFETFRQLQQETGDTLDLSAAFPNLAS